MKIIVSVGHPAHVHYFKNAAKILIENGNEILFFIRERECIRDLVEQLGFEYVCYGTGGDNLISKITNIPIIDYKLFKIAIKFKPDLFLSAGSFYAGHIATLMRKPHITFTDTEHAKVGQLLVNPFSTVVFSPYVWSIKLHKKQILFNALLETFYLNKKVININEKALNCINISSDDKYCIIRFISWNAYHDVGETGLDYNNKIRLVKELSKICKVFISSEGNLPKELEMYRLTTHPSDFHSVIEFASLCISEGSTTASESAVLGTPAIYVNPLKVSNCDEEERYGLVYQSTNVDNIIAKALDILYLDNSKDIYKERRDKLTFQMIDANEFLVWFIENYPESHKIMKENPEYQNRFR